MRNLRDYGMGKSSIEDLILDELKELQKILYPPELDRNGEKGVAREIDLDTALTACITNVIWWIMASECGGFVETACIKSSFDK